MSNQDHLKPFFTVSPIPIKSAKTINNLIIVIIGVSSFLYYIIYLTQSNNNFIPNKLMFMNMMMDNYEKSVYDFNDYINKVIDDNDKIQNLLGNAKTKYTPQSIPGKSVVKTVGTSSVFETKPTTDSTINSTDNPADSLNKMVPVFGSTDNTDSSSISLNSVFSKEGFTGNNMNVANIKNWLAIYIKKFLSGFYIKRNTIYIKA